MRAERAPSRGRRPARRGPTGARGSAVEIAVADGVGRLTLARPATRNRLDAALQGTLVEGCEALEDDERVRVVVLAARGAAFSAGLPAGVAWPEPPWPDGVGAVARLTKPVIAAVGGEAVGWGFALALACDLRIASTAAAFALPGGVLPGGGVTQRLPRLIGTARAMELVLLGTRLAAVAAAAWGLVTTVVEPARLGPTVGETARMLAARGPLALRLGKEAVLRALDLPLEDGIRMEEDLYVLLQTTADREEGVRAFLERRKPRFSGR